MQGGGESIKAIAIVDENWAIGANGDQPIKIPEDFRYFRYQVRGKVIVMGRVTLETLPDGLPLKDCINIILTKNAKFKIFGASVCNSFEGLMNCLKGFSMEDIFVVGGQQVYSLLLPFCDTAYITKVFTKVKGTDRFFPDLDVLADWELVWQSDFKEYEGLRFCFCEYRRG